MAPLGNVVGDFVPGLRPLEAMLIDHTRAHCRNRPRPAQFKPLAEAGHVRARVEERQLVIVSVPAIRAVRKLQGAHRPSQAASRLLFVVRPARHHARPRRHETIYHPFQRVSELVRAREGQQGHRAAQGQPRIHSAAQLHAPAFGDFGRADRATPHRAAGLQAAQPRPLDRRDMEAVHAVRVPRRRPQAMPYPRIRPRQHPRRPLHGKAFNRFKIFLFFFLFLFLVWE